MKNHFARFSAVELLITLLALITLAPFVEAFHYGQFVVTGLLVLILIAAVLCAGASRRRLVIASILAVLVVIVRIVSFFRNDHASWVATYVAALAFCGFVIIELLRYVMRAPRVTSDVLCAAIATYILMGLAWSAAYLLESHAELGAFAFSSVHRPDQGLQSFEAFYFSLVTLTTVGFGDITPVSPVARMLAATEAMVGVLYVAILVAHLVSLYRREDRER
jgi:hypothetical protein